MLDPLRRLTRRGPWPLAAAAVAGCALVAMVVTVVAPWFEDVTTYGFHDWDVVTSHRYLVKLSLLTYHQFPGWNPYACGGFPAWGYVEGAPNLVSPWLPAYLWLPLPLALRVETLGMALLGGAGAYVLAGRFTRSSAARLLVAALWAVNGRWGLQTASGHTWHLAYAWTPWCAFFFERARQHVDGWPGDGRPGRLGDVALLGLGLAMLVYSGGIYPLPHTVLLLSCYGVLCAIEERSLRPLATLAAGGLVGIGLAAPKLLPLLDTFSADPRRIDSTESLGLGALVTLLTSRQQGFHDRPARVSPYGWHEWGMYISVAGVAILALGVLLVQGKRERSLKVVGALFGLLGLGAFHEAAPWTLLHRFVPVFQSQHVPSRFLYPAVLVLALVAASGLGRLIERRRRRRPWLDLAATLAVAALGVDVALVAQKPMRSAMWMVPSEIPAGRPFHFEHDPPFPYVRRDWAGPMLLSMMANTGVINCYGVPPQSRARPGALAVTDRRYQGEIYVEGGGQARIVSWTPNAVDVEVTGAGQQADLVYNMSYRSGWRSNAGPVRPRHRAVAVAVPEGDSRIRLWYVPPGMYGGAAICALTVLALAGAWRRRERAERSRACCGGGAQ